MDLQVPAPRERARPGRRARQDASPTTGCTTGSSSTPRARRCRRASATCQPARPHGALRPAGLPDAAAAVALPRPGHGRPGQHRRRRQGAGRPRLVRGPHARRAGAAPDAEVLAKFRERDGRRPRHGRRPRRCCSTRSVGRTARSTPGRPTPPRWSPPRTRSHRRSAWCWRRRATSLPTWPIGLAALDAARAAKDFATADALRAELQAAGWTVETTREGTSLRR